VNGWFLLSFQPTRTPRNYSIDHLGSKVLSFKDNSINSTISASALFSLTLHDVGVLPLGETALARQFRILSTEAIENGSTETNDDWID